MVALHLRLAHHIVQLKFPFLKEPHFSSQARLKAASLIVNRRTAALVAPIASRCQTQEPLHTIPPANGKKKRFRQTQILKVPIFEGFGYY
jgi:hypothetical protein